VVRQDEVEDPWPQFLDQATPQWQPFSPRNFVVVSVVVDAEVEGGECGGLQECEDRRKAPFCCLVSLEARKTGAPEVICSVV